MECMNCYIAEITTYRIAFNQVLLKLVHISVIPDHIGVTNLNDQIVKISVVICYHLSPEPWVSELVLL